jgi:hypothetical protein
MISITEAKPISQIMVERKPKLLARLHQTEHDIARNTAIAAITTFALGSLCHQRSSAS